MAQLSALDQLNSKAGGRLVLSEHSLKPFPLVECGSLSGPKLMMYDHIVVGADLQDVRSCSARRSYGRSLHPSSFFICWPGA